MIIPAFSVSFKQNWKYCKIKVGINNSTLVHSWANNNTFIYIYTYKG